MEELDNRSDDEKLERMEELMLPINKQLMMCDDFRDQLMIASCMLVTARDILEQHLGFEGSKEMIKNFYESNYEDRN